jgi:hypothetical protein
MKNFTSFILALLLLTGCYSDLENLEIGTIELSPEVAIPLIDSKFSIRDLLESADSAFNYDTDSEGTLILSISDSLYSESAASIYALDNQQVDLPPIPLTPDEITTFNSTGIVSIERSVAVDFPTQSALELLILESGFIELTFTEDFPATGLVNIDIFNYQGSVADPNIIDFSYDWVHIDGGNPSTGTLQSNSFGPIEFIFDGSETGNINLSVGLTLEKVGNNNLVLGENSLNLSLNFSELIFEEMRGDLPSEPLNAGPQTVETQFFDGGQLLSDLDVFFERPSFTLLYSSTFGIPARFQLADFTTYTDGNEEVLSTDGTTELAAGTSDQPSEAQANLDQTFKTIINELPDSVSVSIEGALDPDNRTDNFVTKDSRIDIDYEVNIPLELSLSGLEIEEEIQIDGIDTEDLLSAKFKMVTRNSLPIDLNLEAVFLDQDSVELYTIVNEGILAGGTVENPTLVVTLFELEDDPSTTQNELDFLSQVQSVGIRASVSTTNGGQEVVIISSDAEVSINLALQGQYRVTIN